MRKRNCDAGQRHTLTPPSASLWYLQVKQYHPDVVKDMDKDEAEHRFIALQSAYELLTDEERRAEYDKEHREHPLAANQAFQAYMARRKKAFDQRGDLAMVRVMKTNVA
jgi:DnaJ-class molecular chaperone